MDTKKLKKTLRKEIFLANKIFIVGHNDLDLDAIGAIIGINLIVKKLNKKPFIIIDDEFLETGVEKVLSRKKQDLKIITRDILDEQIDKNSLLIIVDTNKDKLICCGNILEKFKSIIIIDHHKKSQDTIKTEHEYILEEASSTCEIITELIRAFNIKISPVDATSLFAGIVLDTNNFTLKANRKTFYYAYYLLSKGAEVGEVQYLLKQDMPKFIKNQKILANTTYITENIVIAEGEKKEIYQKEDLAKVADSLLQFNEIETSFVIGYIDKDEIGISARSSGDIDVGKIMEELFGGGSKSEAATKITNKDIKEVKKELINLLK